MAAKGAIVVGPEVAPVGAEEVETAVNLPEEEVMGGLHTNQLPNRSTRATTLNSTQEITLSNNMQTTIVKSTTLRMILMARSTTAMERKPNSILRDHTKARRVSTLDKQTSLITRLKRSQHIRSRVINQRINLSRNHRPMRLHRPLPIREK